MEVKDTVMNDQQIGDLLDLEKEATYPCSNGSETTTIDCNELINAQAEISFKAGIREVVESVNLILKLPQITAENIKLLWQAKLNDWNV